MARVALKFISITDDKYIQELEVYATNTDQIVLDVQNSRGFCESLVILDLSTAIRFDKELRKQIGLIKNQG